MATIDETCHQIMDLMVDLETKLYEAWEIKSLNDSRHWINLIRVSQKEVDPVGLSGSSEHLVFVPDR